MSYCFCIDMNSSRHSSMYFQSMRLVLAYWLDSYMSMYLVTICRNELYL